MVASKNRMFRNASGKIVTVQDAVKAGLVNAEDIPKNKEAAIAFRDKLRDNLGQQDRDRLIDAASQRVGYRLTEKNMQVSGAAPKKTEQKAESKTATQSTKYKKVRGVFEVPSKDFFGDGNPSLLENARKIAKMRRPDGRGVLAIGNAFTKMKAAKSAHFT